MDEFAGDFHMLDLRSCGHAENSSGLALVSPFEDGAFG